jgi:hypothetical protein
MRVIKFQILNKLVQAKHKRLRKLANSVKPYEETTHTINIEVIKHKRLFTFSYKKASRKLYLCAIAKLA